MKKGIVFLLGFLAGIVFTFVVVIGVAGSSKANDNGITMFEQPGECLSVNRFEVMQTIGDNYALAYEQEKYFNNYGATDLLVLVTNDNGEFYYDNQIIEVPKGKCMRQVGVYKYQTKAEIWKTVPIVKIMDLP